MISRAKENFLKALFSLQETRSRVYLADVAKVLCVTKGAASQMAQRLKKEKLIVHFRGKGIVLSDEGRKLAVKIVRRHRLWEAFLVEVLGYGWEEVHAEAEHLEHHCSEDLMNRIDAYLGYPRFDPHGYPIPDAEGQLPEVPQLTPLAKAEKGQTYKIARIDDTHADVVAYLGEIGIMPGKELSVLEHFSFDQSLKVQTDTGEHTLGHKTLEAIELYAS